MFGTITDAIVGGNVIVSVSVGSPPVVTELLQLRSIKWSGNKTKMVDVTCMSSPSAVEGGLPVEESRPTIISPGTLTLAGIFGPVDASQLLVQQIQYQGTINLWTITLPPVPGGETPRGEYQLNAYVSECGATDIDFSKEMTYSVSLALSGPYEYVPGV